MDNSFYKYIYRKSTINRINKKCKLLGVKSNLSANKFFSYRLLVSILTFIIVLIFNNKRYIYSLLIALIVYFCSEYYLDYKIRKRSDKLNNEAIFFFQVLALTLESGKNLQGGIELTCKTIDSEISDEFKKVLNEVELGKSLIESLESMKSRMPSDEINTVILNITQSTIFGNNVIESLNNQITYLRDRKLLNIRAKINKMPLKISIVSVIFIIPIVLLLVLGPVIVNFLSK